VHFYVLFPLGQGLGCGVLGLRNGRVEVRVEERGGGEVAIAELGTGFGLAGGFLTLLLLEVFFEDGVRYIFFDAGVRRRGESAADSEG
jgi:hypothetical protein